MAGRITLWGAGEMLASFFSKITEPPENFYLALVRTVPPTPYLSGAEIDEPQGGGYARAQIPNTSVFWSNQSQPQIILTDEDVTFLVATEDWGTVGYWALCNADVDGFLYAVGDLETPLVVSAGDTVVLGEGDLSIALGPFYSEEG